MRITVPALLISTLVISGCATKANPFNWFGGRDRVPAAATADNTNPLIPEATGLLSSRNEEVVYLGKPLETVSAVLVDRTPDGIIVRATGISARQGAYEAQLTPVDDDEKAVDGVLSYRIEALQGPGAVGGPVAAREVTVAHKISNQTLRGTRTIRIEARSNAVQVRR